MLRLIRQFLSLGVIIGGLPNNIANGQAVDAVPVMADFNWIVSQVNSNAAPVSVVGTVGTLQTQVNGLGSMTTFTPTVNFGGAAVGLTYSATGQFGFSFTLGAFVFVMGLIFVTNKGASVGNIQVAGLPVTSGARTISATIPGYYMPLGLGQVSNPSTTGNIVPAGFIPQNSNVMNIYGMQNGLAMGQYNQADCAASFQIYFSGMYPSA